MVNGKGELSGAGYFETWDMQKMLLQEEGVEVTWDGERWKVDLRKYQWKNTLDEALELQREFQCPY